VVSDEELSAVLVLTWCPLTDVGLALVVPAVWGAGCRSFVRLARRLAGRRVHTAAFSSVPHALRRRGERSEGSARPRGTPPPSTPPPPSPSYGFSGSSTRRRRRRTGTDPHQVAAKTADQCWLTEITAEFFFSLALSYHLVLKRRHVVAVPGPGAASGAAAALASDRDGTTAITDCIESAMGPLSYVTSEIGQELPTRSWA